MQEKQFTWIGFYMELADRLLEYRDNRSHLIGKLRYTFDSISSKFPKLDSMEEPADIDPYTVFGLFNKGITETNRKNIIGALAEEFGVKAEQPSDFDGVPVLNNLNATFYAFTDDPRRGEHDIDNLWRLFEAELVLASADNEENRAKFVDAFDATVGQFGLGWKLTMGLYWVRPHLLIHLVSRNRWYLGDIAAAGQTVADVFPKEKDSPITDGYAYLAICDTVSAQLGTEECPYSTFSSLSNAAFIESERVNKEREKAEEPPEKRAEENALGDADVETTHYWLYAPGEGASMWDEFYDKGIMGLGWRELGDLASCSAKEDMRLKLVEREGGGTSQKNAAHAVWQLAHDLKPGDVVFAKQGRTKIIGRGIVTGDYEYDASAGAYPNIRSVEWTHKGEWINDEMFAMKTLTDVTDYTELVAKINAFFQDETDGVIEDELIIERSAYNREDFLSEVYLSEDQYDSLVCVLRAKKNIILRAHPV